ncbi:anti-sigma F factor [Pirellulimonas nuda]|uniref:Anti-sigma F factor n=1 Tax=Pirellulimonas nuda TaxID=2528009 RepID=A0A518DGP6_9BACT|nr:ATP-binding protein [Pirellulimonas nuda]QDU90647.1 anti-sigma F factor [Pirellulimonas nuda]
MKEAWDWTVATSLPSRRGAHLPLMEDILERMASLGWSGRDFFAVQMALEESLANAIKHGNQCNEAKQVRVDCRCSRDKFRLEVEDEGAGFTPMGVADCTSEEGLEAACGRGMLLIQAYMDTVTHNEQGNLITMEKARAAAEPE